MNSRRDYKSVATGPRRQRARRNGLVVVTLVLIGLFGGLLAYIRGDRTKPAPVAAVAPTTPAQPVVAPPAPPPKTVVAPVAEPTLAKPKYDFYTELPKRQIDIQPEAAHPKSAPPTAPSRTQPATDPLRKPTAPRKSTAMPIMATAAAKPTDARPAMARPDAKPADAKPADAKPAMARPDAKPAAAKPTDARPAAAKPAAKPANAQSTPGTALARTAQPPRPLADNGSKVVVKAERGP
ncbi:MAG: hypothetical protein P9F19_08030 [Candidatus Contendobacter sp.]|nr:hypothetical protein [Candidatus Contendobacter sp.]MDG4557319.1 hypothetical protein [Candidatus Contendobacter sp.]